MIKKILSVALASGIMIASAQSEANATTFGNTITTGTCNLGDVQATNPDAAFPPYLISDFCLGEIETNSDNWTENNDSTSGGNPLLDRLNSGDLFDLEGVVSTQGEWTLEGEWFFGGKHDGSIELGDPIDYGFEVERIGDNSGTWTTNIDIENPFMISLKGSNGFAIYGFENSAELANSGIWQTTALLTDGGQTPGISHASLYILKEDTPPSSIPEGSNVLAMVFLAGTLGLSTFKRSL